MAQLYNDQRSSKLRPLSLTKIIEQLEQALMAIKYNNYQPNEFDFNQIVDVTHQSEIHPQFIGRESMLFEMIGILNGKISELQKKFESLKPLDKKEERLICEKSYDIVPLISEIFETAKLAKSGRIDQNQAMEVVFNISQKLLNTTTPVLDSKEENDNLQLSLTPVKLNGLISEVVDAMKSQSQVPLRVGFDNDIEIVADKARLKQVIQTILKNSIDNTKEGYIKLETFVAHEQNVVILRINDTGKRIPADRLQQIFEKPSETIKPKTKDDLKLNHYLCDDIIKGHNGKIYVKNNKTLGVTFTITLPIKS